MPTHSAHASPSELCDHPNRERPSEATRSLWLPREKEEAAQRSLGAEGREAPQEEARCRSGRGCPGQRGPLQGPSESPASRAAERRPPKPKAQCPPRAGPRASEHPPRPLQAQGALHTPLSPCGNPHVEWGAGSCWSRGPVWREGHRAGHPQPTESVPTVPLPSIKAWKRWEGGMGRSKCPRNMTLGEREGGASSGEAGVASRQLPRVRGKCSSVLTQPAKGAGHLGPGSLPDVGDRHGSAPGGFSPPVSQTAINK